MTERKGSIGVREFAVILLLGFCWALTFQFPFISYLLYEPFKEALGVSNAEMGVLITVFGFGNIFGAPVGGWLADRYNYKKILVLAVAMTGAIAVVFSMNITYTMAIICWIGLAISALLLTYPAYAKALRLLVSDENQGKVFGLNEACMGVGSIIASWAFLHLFAQYTLAKAGMEAVILALGIMLLVCAVLCIFVVPAPQGEQARNTMTESGKVDEPGAGLGDFLRVAAQKETWLVGIGIFCVYSLYVTLSYFTPYFSAVFGISATATGFLSLVRTYVLRLGGAPFGGWLGDKLKSVSKVLGIVYVGSIILLGVFLVLPASTPINLVIGLTIALAFFVYMGRGVYFATVSELKVPDRNSAMTYGIAGALGFCPDLFQFILFGHWLDTYGVTGYSYMFMYTIAVLLVGVAATVYILKSYKKEGLA